MNQTERSFRGAMLLTLLGGAALGALALALTTPKTGREFRNKLKALADRLRIPAGPAGPAEDDDVVAMFI